MLRSDVEVDPKMARMLELLGEESLDSLDEMDEVRFRVA